MDTGDGVYAFTGNEPNADPHFATAPLFVERALNPAFLARLAELNRDAPAGVYDPVQRRVAYNGGLERTYGGGSPIVQHFRALMQPAGIVDGFSTFARDGEYGNLTMAAPSRSVVVPASRVRGIWNRVLLHAAAALRLRRKLAAKRTEVDAVLDPSGKLRDARVDVPREALRAAVKAMDRARPKRLRSTPEEALELWQGLVAGEWSLVEQWERGSKRYLAAYRNQPLLVDPRALVSSEPAIVRYVTLGASNKDIAFALGLPLGTVSSSITSILRKLKLKRRVDLVLFAEPSRFERFDVDVDDDIGDLGVLAIDAEPSLTPPTLTPTEREVAALAMRGWTNARIAARRGVSVKTVMNQLRAVYEKLGVTSRSELSAKLRRRPRRAT
ncbi:MAG: LuxR C-terminal-related transcriptional regulator [Labilithrix sp.]